VKADLGEAHALLLQAVGDGGKFVGQKGIQIAFFAAYGEANFAGMDHRVDIDGAEGGSV